MAFMQYSPVSDHFQYVALIGILTFLAASLTHLKHRHPRTGNLITLLLVSFFSFTAYTQAHIYHDEHSFWQAAVSRNPASPQAQYNLGTVLQSEGQNDQAIACYRRATTLDPHCADAHSNLGLLLTRAGSFPEGTAELRQALADKPDATAYRNLSLALITTPQWQEAISLLEHAVHLEPNDSELHSLLGAAYSSHSLYPQAISEARQSANLSPKNPTRLNDLAWLLATQPTPLPSDRPQAVQYAQQACLLTHYQDPAILDTLAVAYHANGQTPEALTTESQALTLAQSNPSQHPLIQELTTHLNQFRSPPSH
jgi:Flp pilus assembly protein TadD